MSPRLTAEYCSPVSFLVLRYLSIVVQEMHSCFFSLHDPNRNRINSTITTFTVNNMSFVYLIRHAQASAQAADYDQLSPLGFTQSDFLYQHFQKQEQKVDHVWIGPRKRHRQTYERARQPTWPAPVFKPWLDEFPAHDIMEKGINTLKGAEWSEDIANIQSSVGTGSESFLRVLQHLCDQWITSNLILEDVENGAEYLSRIEMGLHEIMNILSSGESIILFSSAGLIGSTTGLALGADPKLSLRNAWAVYNASIHIMRAFQNQYMMVGFNWIDHIPSSKRTFV